jgi:murein DD-endopeptidase MepM/ murein hydrolase activator NlpD
VLNGEPKQPHYGVDLAAPSGTPIHAPAAGLVVLAEPDMFLEGGLTMIDHGQGLISYYLHQSRQHVQAGQRVERRQLIGEVGMKGRATGNHLCWRLTWRGRHMDPSLLIGAAAPA